MNERVGAVTMQGNPVTLLGDEIKTGHEAPDFKVVDGGFAPVRLSDFSGKTVIISVVPSLDTGVCALQTKRFNEEAVNLGDEVVVLTISADLPFAQGRFCEAEKIEGVNVLSDSVWRDFGEQYGLYIKDMGLLARAIFVVSPEGNVVYHELVPEITDHPDYDAALSAVK